MTDSRARVAYGWVTARRVSDLGPSEPRRVCLRLTLGEEARSGLEIDDREDGEDGDEEKEADLGRGTGQGLDVVPVGHYWSGQQQHSFCWARCKLSP